MMSAYFGDNAQPGTAPIWAELQWTGWLIDGGVPLMLAEAAALLLALREAFRVATSKDPAASGLSAWAGIVVGFDMGLIALTFNACPFSGTLGVDFWLLNAALFAAFAQTREAASRVDVSARSSPLGAGTGT